MAEVRRCFVVDDLGGDGVGVHAKAVPRTVG